MIGTAARFCSEKGIDRLLLAASQLRSEGRNVEVRLAGDGSLRPKLEELAQSLGIADAVHFVGVVSDMPAFYSNLDVFVSPSLSSEGLSLSFLEAMAMGKAVVATTVGGAAEAVTDSVDGFLVAPDDVNALAGALRILLRDHALREKMGRNARERVEQQFTTRQMVNAVWEMYHDC